MATKIDTNVPCGRKQGLKKPQFNLFQKNYSQPDSFMVYLRLVHGLSAVFPVDVRVPARI